MPDASLIVVLAGQRYREFLMDYLVGRAATVHVPMAGMRNGQQLSWLGKHSHNGPHTGVVSPDELLGSWKMSWDARHIAGFDQAKLDDDGFQPAVLAVYHNAMAASRTATPPRRHVRGGRTLAGLSRRALS